MSTVGDSVLVTGGAGFIGQNFVWQLAGRNVAPRIVVLDALTYAANPTHLEPLVADRRIEIVHGDIADHNLVASLFEQHRFQAVVHLAAESHVDRSIDEP